MAGGVHGRGACMAGGSICGKGVRGGECAWHARPPPPPDTMRYGSMSGRYASYWNAYL